MARKHWAEVESHNAIIERFGGDPARNPISRFLVKPSDDGCAEVGLVLKWLRDTLLSNINKALNSATTSKPGTDARGGEKTEQIDCDLDACYGRIKGSKLLIITKIGNQECCHAKLTKTSKHKIESALG